MVNTRALLLLINWQQQQISDDRSSVDSTGWIITGSTGSTGSPSPCGPGIKIQLFTADRSISVVLSLEQIDQAKFDIVYQAITNCIHRLEVAARSPACGRTRSTRGALRGATQAELAQ